jgi:hypothetical protein
MRISSAFALLAVQVSLAAQAGPPPYRDPARPADERAADLLARMTVEEKVAQLQTLWKRYARMQTPDGGFDPARARDLLGQGIGQIARPSEVANPPAGQSPTRTPKQHVTFTNAVQRWLIDNTRLGIPAMFHEEALHGLVAPNGTQFPVPIGLGSTWDPALVERVMSIAAAEARARAGDEVVQLYIRDLVSSVTRPTKELRGFERVTLAPGEKRTVTFTLSPAELSLIDRRMQRIVEPGRFEVMAGSSSRTQLTATLDVVSR